MPDDPTPAATAFDFESAVSGMVEDMPEPQPHAMKVPEGEGSSSSSQPVPSAPPAGETDDSGVAWNPLFHATGRDGKGVKTAKGTWRARRGVGKPRLDTGAGSSASAAPPAPPQPSAQEQAARAGGMTAANLLMTAGIGLFGTEWEPRVDQATGLDERKFLQGAFADYFVSKGWGDLPPGLALATAVGFYALPRLHMPHTQKRVGGIAIWFKVKWLNFRLRKHGVRVVPIERDENDPYGLKKYGYKVVDRPGKVRNIREEERRGPSTSIAD